MLHLYGTTGRYDQSSNVHGKTRVECVLWLADADQTRSMISLLDITVEHSMLTVLVEMQKM
jgi:hypothetical protein